MVNNFVIHTLSDMEAQLLIEEDLEEELELIQIEMKKTPIKLEGTNIHAFQPTDLMLLLAHVHQTDYQFLFNITKIRFLNSTSAQHDLLLLCLGGRSHEAYSSSFVCLSVSQSVSQSFRPLLQFCGAR